MDPVNDLMIFGSAEVSRLEKEVEKLQRINSWLRCGVIILGVVGITLIWVMLYSGKKAGYNEAIRDFQTGKLKIENVKK